MLNSLSGRFLILTVIFVMLAEVLIFVPSVARFREDYLYTAVERAHIASLAALSDDMVNPALERELLETVGVYNIVLRADDARQLVLSSEIPSPVAATYDLRDATAVTLIRDAMATLVQDSDEIVRVLATPPRRPNLVIEVTLADGPLRMAMLQYGLRVLILSAVISGMTAILLFWAVRRVIVLPIRGVVQAMESYAEAPEDARRVIVPSAGVRELRTAEQALRSLQTQLTAALRQRQRLAQLGGAVAKISHDLRNVLTTAQLFADRLEETSEDPTAKRLLPKLLNSISRAISICEGTLAFGRVDEPQPALQRVPLGDIVEDVIEGERLAAADQNVTIERDIPHEMYVRADPEQLYRVLGNLVRNARQALALRPEGGRIAILGRETESDWIVEVSDTGPGLPPRARDHLFEPFASASGKGGTGLGLTIAHELVRGHGGTLTLVETGPEGTRFEIRLPRAVVGLDAAE